MSPATKRAIDAVIVSSDVLRRAAKGEANAMWTAMAVTGLVTALRDNKVDTEELRSIAMQLAGWAGR